MHFEGDTRMDMSMQGPIAKSVAAFGIGHWQEGDVRATVSADPHQGVGGRISDYFPNGPIGSKVDYDPTEGLGPAPSTKKHAYTFLEAAVKEMKDRAIQRDTPSDGAKGGGGERSMAATVRAFNALTGKNLTEAEGWEFMILLKLVRGRQGAFRADDYVDAAAYAGLLGECESTSR